MHISFSPQRRDDELTVAVAGEVLTINGVDYDLSVIPEGSTLPRDAIDNNFIAGDISRKNGVLSVVLLLPHKAKPNQAIAFPEPVSVATGVVIDTANAIYPWGLV